MHAICFAPRESLQGRCSEEELPIKGLLKYWALAKSRFHLQQTFGTEVPSKSFPNTSPSALGRSTRRRYRTCHACIPCGHKNAIGRGDSSGGCSCNYTLGQNIKYESMNRRRFGYWFSMNRPNGESPLDLSALLLLLLGYMTPFLCYTLYRCGAVQCSCAAREQRWYVNTMPEEFCFLSSQIVSRLLSENGKWFMIDLGGRSYKSKSRVYPFRCASMTDWLAGWLFFRLLQLLVNMILLLFFIIL